MIYVTGDMHGDESRLYSKQWRKLKADDILIICGDFGYLWNNSKAEKSVINYLGTRKFTVCFLDGTHENFDLINKGRETVWKGGRVHRIHGNLLHLMRGQVFTINKTTIFTFGGGESDDKDIRIEAGTWWRDEQPTPSQMAEGAANLDDKHLKVDYILTHEPPSLVKSSILLRDGRTDKTNKLNGFLQEIDNSCKYKHWYFGSMHKDKLITPNHTAVFKKIVPLGFKGQIDKL